MFGSPFPGEDYESHAGPIEPEVWPDPSKVAGAKALCSVSDAYRVLRHMRPPARPRGELLGTTYQDQNIRDEYSK